MEMTTCFLIVQVSECAVYLNDKLFVLDFILFPSTFPVFEKYPVYIKVTSHSLSSPLVCAVLLSEAWVVYKSIIWANQHKP